MPVDVLGVDDFSLGFAGFGEAKVVKAEVGGKMG
jgi:hypothetical protein